MLKAGLPSRNTINPCLEDIRGEFKQKAFSILRRQPIYNPVPDKPMKASEAISCLRTLVNRGADPYDAIHFVEKNSYLSPSLFKKLKEYRLKLKATGAPRKSLRKDEIFFEDNKKKKST